MCGLLMKNLFQSLILLLAAVVLVLSGCMANVRLYEGEERPRSEIAIVTTDWFILEGMEYAADLPLEVAIRADDGRQRRGQSGSYILSVDGTDTISITQSMNCNITVELLPGVHILEVTTGGCTAGVVTTDPRRFEFTAYRGHQYIYFQNRTNLSETEIESVDGTRTTT